MTDSSSTHIPLEGALNLRDIGGYATPSGSVTTGVVFRSDNLAELTDADLATFDRLGIRAVYDFRGDREVELQPSRFWSTVVHPIRVPISEDQVQEKSFVEKVEARELVSVSEEEVGESYISILEDKGHQFAPVLEAIGSDDHVPVLFHCTAGKDRTGLAAALILEICGVDRATVLDDYELTNELRAYRRVEQLRPSLEEAGVDVEAVWPALSAPRSALEMTLAHLDDSHGGSSGYLSNTLGFGDDGVETLRGLLII